MSKLYLIKDGKTKPANITYNFADKKYRGDIALQGKLEGKFHASIGLKVYVQKEKGRAFDSTINKDEFGGISLGAEASASVTIMLGVNFGKDNNWDTDFYFSGLTLKVWFAAGLNKKEKPKSHKIIPDLNAKIDILKGKFEIK